MARTLTTDEVSRPAIQLDPDVYPAVFGTDEDAEDAHEYLLDYLEHRLSQGHNGRASRLTRYATVDKTVSTWQALDEEDVKRTAKQEATGKAQAMHINLPLTHTHLEDMSSFYSNIYSPASGSFYQVPETSEESVSGQKLVDKLNQDAEASKYFSELTKGMRSLLKYNIGGFGVLWANEDQTDIDDATDGMNHTYALDMYNFLWDPEVKDPARIPKEAEWAATISHRTLRWLIQREKLGMFTGVGGVIPEAGTSNGNSATYYRYPPSEAGVTAKDSPAKGGSGINWDAYGAGLASDASPEISGHEVIHMYCWLNPYQFDLVDEDPNDYQLWQFYIVDMERIVYAKPVVFQTEDETKMKEIPFYVGYMLQDDMGSQQRSTAELMTPFQNFASFLLNAHISGTRSSIWGLQGYDPQMFDMGSIPEGATVARLASKIPGRDVRSGLIDMRGQVDTSQTMQSLQALLSIMQQFFPAQALPSQIAGIDRAVQSQVAAVMQGVNRRMHMIVRIMDSDILGPMSQQKFRNIALNASDNYAGLTEAQARKILGTGLLQLNKEQAEAAFRQLLFAVIQNPNTAQNMDVMAMISYWGKLLNIPVPVESFRLQQAPAAQPGGPGASPTQPAPGPGAIA